MLPGGYSVPSKLQRKLKEKQMQNGNPLKIVGILL